MFSSSFVFSVVLAVASIRGSVASCAHGTHLHRRQVTEEGKVEISNFGYTGLQGPLNWAGLDEANSACRQSNVQSPIVFDQNSAKAQEAPRLVIDNVEEAEFENLGTTLETIVTGTTTFAGVDFKLQQFHLHTPSEHRINEEFFPVEMHMVHEADNGAIAVIAIPFQLTEDGSTTELLTSVIENIDDVREPGSVTKTGALNFEELINAVQTKPLFQYTGSLTTPPCAEGLTFLVLEEPLPINVKTFNTLKSVIKFNARYSQNSLGQTNLLEVAAELAAEELGCAALGEDRNDVEPIDNAANEDEEEEDEENVNEENEENVNEENVNENVNENENEEERLERERLERERLERERLEQNNEEGVDREEEERLRLERERLERERLERERLNENEHGVNLEDEERLRLERERLERIERERLERERVNVHHGVNREDEERLRREREERLRLEHEREQRIRLERERGGHHENLVDEQRRIEEERLRRLAHIKGVQIVKISKRAN